MKPGRMHFRHGARDEPEINLIPFIDVLLVVLIFLMLSTTYSKFTEMQLRLPTADADAQRDYPKEVIVTVSADGRYSVNRTVVPDRSVETVAAALTAATGGKDSVVIISADASSRAPGRRHGDGSRAPRRPHADHLRHAIDRAGRALTCRLQRAWLARAAARAAAVAAVTALRSARGAATRGCIAWAGCAPSAPACRCRRGQRDRGRCGQDAGRYGRRRTPARQRRARPA
jgi:biopolymer transport protein ExbD